MGVDQVRRLKNRWSRQTGLQQALQRSFDDVGFTESYVSRSIELSRGGHASRRTKFIKDNVWGMVRVGWRATRLIDCPLVQRLRGIRQLGLTYLVYPSAEHTRFVHSVGMAHLVSELLDEADRVSSEEIEVREDLPLVGMSAFSPLTRDEIIFAAILHDVGHMPFSHATEAVLENRKDLFLCGGVPVVDVIADCERILRKSLGLAEVLSLMVILSDRFARFYDDCVSVGHEDPNSILRMAGLVAGIPPEARLSGTAEVISASTVDADKIDYISRDAQACGIPVGVDVSRTLLRCGFVKATRDQLIRAGLKNDPAPEEIIFTVNASGMDTVDEITLARAALYQRVYLHGVTRTAEAILARSLEASAESNGVDDGTRDALRLWALGDMALLSRLSESRSGLAKTLATRIVVRNLPKKACVFSPSLARTQMPLEQLFKIGLTSSHAATLRKQISQTRLETLRRENMLGPSGRRLEAEIRKEIGRLAIRLRQAGFDETVVPEGEPDLVVVIGTAYMDKVRKDGIVLQSGELLRTSHFTTVREQQDAFDIFKAVGYVMCDSDWRSLALIAARTVLGTSGEPKVTSLVEHPAVKTDDDGRVAFVERMILDLHGVARRSGIKKDRLRSVMEAAETAGYFDEFPHLATPSDIGRKPIIEVARSLAGFVGQQGWRVTPTTVAAFLDQFPPRLRDKMLEVLQGLTVFDSTEVATLLRPLLERTEGSVDVAALSPNSGMNARRALDTVGGGSATSRVRVHNEVGTALRHSELDPLYLVDDNLSSGTQATAQILAWLGVPVESWPERCRKEDGIYTTALPEDERCRLRSRPIYVAVCAGRAEGGDALASVLAEHGVRNFKGLKYAREIEARPDEWDIDLRDFLTAVGTELMAWALHRTSTDQLDPAASATCRQRAFGYGNMGAMVVTTDSVPTSTVTAIWSPGLVHGRPWMPLVLRRNKLRHLVLG